MKKTGTYLFLIISWLFSKLPEFVLYGIADIVYIFLYYLLGYRKKTVFNNLTKSFPDKSGDEIKHIAKKFFHHLSEIFVENIAIIKMSKKRILQMVEFEENDIYKKLLTNKKNIVGVTAHYGNWELFLTLPKIIPHIVFGVYKPLNNAFFDKQFYKMRAKFGAIPVTMNDTYKTIVKYKKENELIFLGLIADQSPLKIHNKYWSTFLNQETAVFPGPEKIAKKLNYAVVFTYLEKIKRGKYIIKSSLLFDDVSQCKKFEITETHLKFLEQLIIKKPEYYLWSHKRWKYNREESSF
ncbi:MAG: lysophospholipid acyltransferase family protein [Bacteroidales bacterium]|nr:lysophospholipid acyltransferase family protein [Bacteroidales bacterium]